MNLIVGIAVPTLIIGFLVYVYIDIHLHPKDYLKPRTKRRNKRKK